MGKRLVGLGCGGQRCTNSGSFGVRYLTESIVESKYEWMLKISLGLQQITSKRNISSVPNFHSTPRLYTSVPSSLPLFFHSPSTTW